MYTNFHPYYFSDPVISKKLFRMLIICFILFFINLLCYFWWLSLGPQGFWHGLGNLG